MEDGRKDGVSSSFRTRREKLSLQIGQARRSKSLLFKTFLLRPFSV
jgi:hypothetical protein